MVERTCMGGPPLAANDTLTKSRAKEKTAGTSISWHLLQDPFLFFLQKHLFL